MIGHSEGKNGFLFVDDFSQCLSCFCLQDKHWDLGIMIDCELTMSSQVSRMCKAAYYHLYAISKIRHCLTTEVCKTIVHALVISRLDYGNALLYGIMEALVPKLQMVQNNQRD